MSPILDEMTGLFAIGIGYIALLLPVLIVWVVFHFANRDKKNRYDALIEISKNVSDLPAVMEMIEDLKDKKTPTDYRRNGVITLGVGAGVALLGVFLDMVVVGAGGLVACIGVGQIIAGYLYPIESEEINRTVENFERE